MLLALVESNMRLETELGVKTMWNISHDVYDCIEWLSGFSFLYCLIVQAGELHVEGSV